MVWPVDPTSAVVTFYGLEALRGAVRPRIEPFRHSHSRWQEDLGELWDRLVPQLARRMFDYLALACFGEARHARTEAAYCLRDFPEQASHGRGAAVKAAMLYNPWQFLPVLERLFTEVVWNSSFGGRSWGRIARAAQLYGKIPDAAFIDHVVDLSHNGGMCFDKGEAGLYVTYSSVYMELLDAKRTLAPEDLLGWIVRRSVDDSCGLPLPRAFVALLSRAVALFGFPCWEYFTWSCWPKVRPRSWADEHFDAILNYCPVEWGNKKLEYELAESEGPGEEEEEEEGIECEGCGTLVPEDEVYEFGGYTYCESCFEDRTNRCGRCGKVDWADSIWWSELYDRYLCDSCWEELVVICDRCGAEVAVGDATYTEDGAPVCPKCYEEVKALGGAV